MNGTTNGLHMLRFMREGVSCEAIFKSREAATNAYAMAVSEVRDAKNGPVWHTVIDDFNVSHTLDLSGFFMVCFSFGEIAQRDLAMKGQHQSPLTRGFMPQ